MLIDDFPFLIFHFGFIVKIFQKVRLFLGAVKKTVLLVDDSQFSLGSDATRFEHDFFIVVSLEAVFRFAVEIQAEELPPAHLLDVRIPDGRVVVEVERHFAAAQFLLSESYFYNSC